MAVKMIIAEDKIVVKNLSKVFAIGEIKALDNVSFEIKRGGLIGVLGADGSGKTTLLRHLVGLLEPSFGEVLIFGLNSFKMRHKLNENLGYMPQKFGLYEDLSVIENLELYAKLKELPKDKKEEIFEKLFKFTNLAPFKNRLAGKLSGGMKQKLGLTCALLGLPKLLVLDEPSVGVDPISRRELIAMVQELTDGGTTTIWATAYLDEAVHFDSCIVLDKGKIIFQGKSSELCADIACFEEKIIELMGGYENKKSPLVDGFKLAEFNVEYPVVAQNLVKKYGDFYAVRENSFKIKKGEIFGLLGPNGAGKSTSFKMLCGLLRPSSGKALIMGVDMVQNPTLASSYIGYMAQKFSLYLNLSVYQNLDFFAGVYGLVGENKKKEISKIVEIFELGEFLKLDTKELPSGFKQRLALGCALIHKPPILFLDEPTSGVDPIARREFWGHIKGLSSLGVTTMVTTHFMDEAEYCDRISLFFKGETIAIGTPEGLKKQAGVLTMQEAFTVLIEKSEMNLS